MSQSEPTPAPPLPDNPVRANQEGVSRLADRLRLRADGGYAALFASIEDNPVFVAHAQELRRLDSIDRHAPIPANDCKRAMKMMAQAGLESPATSEDIAAGLVACQWVRHNDLAALGLAVGVLSTHMIALISAFFFVATLFAYILFETPHRGFSAERLWEGLTGERAWLAHSLSFVIGFALALLYREINERKLRQRAIETARALLRERGLAGALSASGKRAGVLVGRAMMNLFCAAAAATFYLLLAHYLDRSWNIDSYPADLAWGTTQFLMAALVGLCLFFFTLPSGDPTTRAYRRLVATVDEWRVKLAKAQEKQGARSES